LNKQKRFAFAKKNIKKFWFCSKNFGINRNVPLLLKIITGTHLNVLVSFRS
jgi:hypothetical protein